MKTSRGWRKEPLKIERSIRKLLEIRCRMTPPLPCSQTIRSHSVLNKMVKRVGQLLLCPITQGSLPWSEESTGLIHENPKHQTLTGRRQLWTKGRRATSSHRLEGFLLTLLGRNWGNCNILWSPNLEDRADRMKEK